VLPMRESGVRPWPSAIALTGLAAASSIGSASALTGRGCSATRIFPVLQQDTEVRCDGVAGGWHEEGERGVASRVLRVRGKLEDREAVGDCVRVPGEGPSA
jgi:hypothetical protein